MTKKTKPKVPKKDSKNRERLKTAEYLAFVEFMGTPVFERTLKTQGDFAKEYQVCESTLSDWKKRPGFWVGVEKVRKEYGKGKTSNLLGALYTKMLKSTKPFGRDFMVWLQYVENFSPKTRFEDETPPREITPAEKELVKAALKNIGLHSIINDED